MKYIIATNLLVLAILFVCGLCQDFEQDLDSKSYDDATSASNSEAVKVLKRNKCKYMLKNRTYIIYDVNN